MINRLLRKIGGNKGAPYQMSFDISRNVDNLLLEFEEASRTFGALNGSFIIVDETFAGNAKNVSVSQIAGRSSVPSSDNLDLGGIGRRRFLWT